MIRQNQHVLNMVNCVLDGLLIVSAYLLASWFRLDFLANDTNAMEMVLSLRFVGMAALYAVSMLGLYAALHLYGSFRFKNMWYEGWMLALANGIGVLAVGSIFYLLRMTDFSRLVLLCFYVFSTVLVITKRVVVRALLRHYRSLGYNQRFLLLIGHGPLAQRYYHEICAKPQYGYCFKGYFAPGPVVGMEHYLGEYDAVREQLAAGGVDEVVVAMEQSDTPFLGSVIAACGRFGIKVSVIPPYNDFIPSTPRIELAGSLKLMNVRRTPGKGPVWETVKRGIDVMGALCGLVLSSPLMLGTAIAIKASSSGPAIFAQERVGKNGKTFKMYKFRSMYIDAEEKLAELQKYNEAGGPVFKMANDPRVTNVGRFIRKTSLDELPQLWNILKGDMSIVGPRPPIPREVVQYSDWDWGRLAVKPGLTCYWQISGRSNVTFEEWMRLDLKYVEEQSLWTDLKILFKTVGVVFHGDGAY